MIKANRVQTSLIAKST